MIRRSVAGGGDALPFETAVGAGRGGDALSFGLEVGGRCPAKRERGARGWVFPGVGGKLERVRSRLKRGRVCRAGYAWGRCPVWPGPLSGMPGRFSPGWAGTSSGRGLSLFPHVRRCLGISPVRALSGNRSHLGACLRNFRRYTGRAGQGSGPRAGAWAGAGRGAGLRAERFPRFGERAAGPLDCVLDGSPDLANTAQGAGGECSPNPAGKAGAGLPPTSGEQSAQGQRRVNSKRCRLSPCSARTAATLRR